MSESMELHQLPILRELGVTLRAAAAVEDELALRRETHWTARLWERILYAIGTPFRAVGTGVVLGMLMATILFGTGTRGGPSLDPVASASAALDPPGEVVHLVMNGGPVQTDGTPRYPRVQEGGKTVGTIGRRIERWSASDPFRLRVDVQVRALDGTALGALQTGQAADGTTWEATSWNGNTRRSTQRTEVDRELLPVAAGDPTTMVQQLLRSGRFDEQERVVIDGRRTIRLVATTLGGHNQQGGSRGDTRIDYFVDEKTFTPLRIRLYARPPLTGAERLSPAARAQSTRFVLTRDLTVERYERLPLNDVDAALFRVPPGTGGR